MDTEMLKLALNDAREIKNQLGIITGLENQVVYSSLEGLLEPHGEALAKSALERLRKEGCTIGYQNLVLNHIKN
ncbi:MAG: hypothetical protein M1368_04335, partial [Thaumarchaeota archaeon]|nr:hypothetical protein [Nitrososphaerota archaeon]